FCGMHFLSCNNLLLKPFVYGRVLKISLDIINSLKKPIPELRIDRFRSEFLNIFAELNSKSFDGYKIIREADDSELQGKQLALHQIAQCRNQLPLDKVTAGSEDHHYTRASVLSLFMHEFSHISDPIFHLTSLLST